MKETKTDERRIGEDMTENKKNGKVYLVGGGPGDPGLMTLRGLELIMNADAVVHDRLIGDDIIAMIPEDAEKINVGKYAGDHPFPQEEINRILVDLAKEGKQVVRLKGGDPFIFGRGGEELELLEEENIDFEVVPGITAAVAATAYAGIPVTHRDYCSSLHFITGHAQAGKELAIDFDGLVQLSGTLVFFMSISTSGMIAEGLIDAGMDPDMPTAIVEKGTRSDQRVFVQPLKQLGDSVKKNGVVSPALIIVGKVCELSNKFGWFDKLPLKGKHFLVTRPEGGASRLAEGLRRLGAKATVRPAIKTSPIRPLDLPKDSGSFDTVVFTSGAGVSSFCDWLLEEGNDMRWFAGKRIACIGKATAAALRGYGISADFVPSVFSGKVLGEEMLAEGFVNEKSRVLLLRTNIASEDVTDVLKKASVAFADVPVYTTELLRAEPEAGEDYDVITFTSKSCVDGYVKSAGDRFHKGERALCIGEKTAEAARKEGFDVTVSHEATIDSMLDKAVEMYAGRK